MTSKTTFLRLPNHPHPYLITGSASDQILAGIEKSGGYYEPYVMNALQHILKPDSVCLDIGANIGAISIAMSAYARQGRVYAFEPSAVNFHYMSYNAHLNGAGVIEPVKLGVFDRNTEMKFSYIDFGGAWSHITTEHAERGIQETIQCVRIDDWAAQKQLTRLDLIKLDVEGAEVPALRGMEKTIAAFKPDMIVEFNPKGQLTIFKEDPKLLYQTLQKLFPHMYIIDFNYTVPRVVSYEQLMGMFVGGREVVDLYCTFKG